MEKFIPLSVPNFVGNEKKYVNEAVEAGWVSTGGKLITDFENKIKDYKEYKEELLNRFELSDKVKKFGDELSKGMQQKLSICCGLLPKPKVLLFDEPMIGLDPHAIKELKNLFETLRSQGCSILISTHMIDSIDMLWDKTIILQNGIVKANVSKTDLENSNTSLEELFFKITEGKEKNV